MYNDSFNYSYPLQNIKYKLHMDNCIDEHGSRGGYSHTLPIRVCAAQEGRDFEASDLERGIHFRGVF